MDLGSACLAVVRSNPVLAEVRGLMSQLHVGRAKSLLCNSEFTVETCVGIQTCYHLHQRLIITMGQSCHTKEIPILPSTINMNRLQRGLQGLRGPGHELNAKTKSPSKVGQVGDPTCAPTVC